MGRSCSAFNMVRISIIVMMVLLASFVSAIKAGSNQEGSERALSDESLLERVERDPGRRRVKGRKRKGTVKRKKSKGRKRKTRGKKNRGKKWGRQTGPDDATCLANIGTVMDYEGNQVANFERQKKRIESFNTLMGKKGGKKDDFANSTSHLETSLGSDKNCSKGGSSGVADTAK